MTDPKPISLTHIDAEAYTGLEPPQPFVVVGDMPGGGGGGTGEVSSVNGKKGTVVLGAGDVGAAPASHTHTVANITGLGALLDEKADATALADLAAEAATALETLSEDVASKASAADVTNQLATKASAEDLDNVFGKLGGMTFRRTTLAALPPVAERPADVVYIVIG